MFPEISIIIPTLNAEKVLEKCLSSIVCQNYPKENIEIIIADGGSTDDTVKIARIYKARVLKNVLKTGEAGKAVGARKAKGELLAFIDSDNILPGKKWLMRMVEPFKDSEILASEPIKYSHRKSDPWLTRYFALLGMNDPICLFLGNYDRDCILTGKWTGLDIHFEDKGRFLKVRLEKEPVPTIGANGFLVRKSALKMTKLGDYLFDIDVLISLMNRLKVVYVGKVKAGIVHTFVEDSPRKFFRKQWRRINDMSFHRSLKNRETDWQRLFLLKIIWFQIQCLLIFPILIQTIKGYIKSKDIAFLFHPLACYSTWFIYLYGWVRGKILPAESDRSDWKQ